MSADNQIALVVKIVLLGDGGTGAKTSVAIRFVQDRFDEPGSPTIGGTFHRKRVEVLGVSVKLEMWGLHLNTREDEKRTHFTENTTHRHTSRRTVPHTDAGVLSNCSGWNRGL